MPFAVIPEHLERRVAGRWGNGEHDQIAEPISVDVDRLDVRARAGAIVERVEDDELLAVIVGVAPPAERPITIAGCFVRLAPLPEYTVVNSTTSSSPSPSRSPDAQRRTDRPLLGITRLWEHAESGRNGV